jgi:hypothetical protein
VGKDGSGTKMSRLPNYDLLIIKELVFKKAKKKRRTWDKFVPLEGAAACMSLTQC